MGDRVPREEPRPYHPRERCAVYVFYVPEDRCSELHNVADAFSEAGAIHPKAHRVLRFLDLVCQLLPRIIARSNPVRVEPLKLRDAWPAVPCARASPSSQSEQRGHLRPRPATRCEANSSRPYRASPCLSGAIRFVDQSIGLRITWNPIDSSRWRWRVTTAAALRDDLSVIWSTT